MGLTQARLTNLPDDIDTDECLNAITSTWTLNNLKRMNKGFQSNNGEPTQSVSSLKLATRHLNDVFKNLKIQENSLNVLEVMSGNCVASQILLNGLDIFVNSWICTDMIIPNKDKTEHQKMIKEEMNSLDAVNAFVGVNVLLMISPPPLNDTTKKHNLESEEDKEVEIAGYGDYYACRAFISYNKSDRFIIFIGELGASDGSPGMYKYLTEHPHLSLIRRTMLYRGRDCFDGPIEKELFVFKTLSF